MFRQIAVREDDREYQLNLCRQNPNKHFLLDKFNFVTYRKSPAPFLVFYCLDMLRYAAKLTHTIELEGLQKVFDRLLEANCSGKHPALGMCWLPQEDFNLNVNVELM